MTCCSSLETTITLRIDLEEQIPEAQPPPAGEPNGDNSENRVATENVVNNDEQQQNVPPRQNDNNENGHSFLFVIHELNKDDYDSDSENLVISDYEPNVRPVPSPVAVQEPAPVQTPAPALAMPLLEHDTTQPEIKPEPQEEQEEQNKNRVNNGGCIRSLFRQQSIYQQYDKDIASSSISYAPGKIEEDKKPKQDINEGKLVNQTVNEDKDETGEGSSCAKRKKIEKPEDDIYFISDDSSDE